MAMKLSVCIITFNEQKNIARCIQSVSGIADEVVVVDSISTDQTREICESFNVRFIEQPFLGYKEQKNFALSKASHENVLSLDADEALSPELLQSVRKAKENGFPADGYTMNRRSLYCDRWIYHGAWYPDTKLRVVKKSRATWKGINPHDKLELEDDRNTIHLDGDILHYTFYTIDEHVLQGNKFSSISAKAYYDQGKRAGIFKLVVNPVWAFFSSYILKRGFLDGLYGYVIAKQIATNTFLKYAKLYQLQQQVKEVNRTNS